MRGFSFAFALILLLAACGTQAAGIKRITIEAGPAGPEIAGAVWYPCATPAQDAGSDNVALSGVKECPLIGDKLPLIVMSNGRMGRFGNHHDTAAALADAGFVVAAINHPKDNGRDHSGTDSLEVLAGRSGDIKRLIDFMLGAWPDSAHVDGQRVGLFGFSMGGYTGLVVIGGNPDFRKGHPRCARSDLRVLPVCGQLENGELPGQAPAHDPRVRAAVIIDPWPGIPASRGSSQIREHSRPIVELGSLARRRRPVRVLRRHDQGTASIHAGMAFRRQRKALLLLDRLHGERGAGRAQTLH